MVMISPVLVIAADGAKARFFSLEFGEHYHPCLREQEALVNVFHDQKAQQLWSSPESQAGHYQEGKSSAHSYDDHRQDHKVEFDRRFVQAIADQVLPQATQLQRLLLIAEPHILGLLRDILIPVLPKTLEVSELDKNLNHLSPQEIYEYLTNQALFTSSLSLN